MLHHSQPLSSRAEALLFAADRAHHVDTVIRPALDAKRVVLTDVRPNADGEVHLSLHAFEGLRVYPSYVTLAPLPDPTGRDPVHHIRLRTPGPVPRVVLVWEHP